MLFVVMTFELLADFFPNKKLTKKRRRPRQNIFESHPLEEAGVVVAILIFNFSAGGGVRAADKFNNQLQWRRSRKSDPVEHVAVGRPLRQ